MNPEFKRMMELAGLTEIKIAKPFSDLSNPKAFQIFLKNLPDSEYINDLMEFAQYDPNWDTFPYSMAPPEFSFYPKKITFTEDFILENYEIKIPYTCTLVYSFEVNKYPDYPYEDEEGDVSLKLISAIITTNDNKTIDITNKFIDKDLKPLENIINNSDYFWGEYIDHVKNDY